MISQVRAWFDRQSLTVRLGLLFLFLCLGLVWVSLPDDPPSSRPLAPPVQPTLPAGERPVLGREGATGAVVSSTAVDPSASFLAPYQEPTTGSAGTSIFSGLRIIISVVIVLVLIVLGAQGLRAMGAAGGGVGRSTSIRVRETVRLPTVGARSSASLHLVEVGERLLLIGASEGHVSLVTEFEQDEIEALPGAGTPRGPGAMARASSLRSDARATEVPKIGQGGGDDAILDSVLQRLGESGRRLRGDE